jgi:hypothetical protein
VCDRNKILYWVFFRTFTLMPPQSPHFWCHQCQQEVQVLMAPDPICQTCNGQFVEQVRYDTPKSFYAVYSSWILTMLRMYLYRLNQKMILEISLPRYMKKIPPQDPIKDLTAVSVPVDLIAVSSSSLTQARMRQKTEVHCTQCYRRS